MKPVSNKNSNVPEIFEYPDTTLSEKQMEALHSVIHQPAPFPEINSETDIGHSDIEQKNAEIGKEDKSLLKTVILVVFLVLFLLAAGAAGWYYWWITYSTFDYELQSVAILEGQKIEVNNFLVPDGNMPNTTIVMQNPDFEPSAGVNFIPLTLTLGLRSLDSSAALYVLTPIEYIEHEFTVTDVIIRPVELISNADAAAGRASFNVRFTEEPLPLEEYPVGEFILHLSLNDEPFEVLLRVIDTTPPTATAVIHTIFIGEDVFPEDFVEDVFDASPIASIRFASEPDIWSHDDQAVSVAIEDIHGNVRTIESQLIILLNYTPPIIIGEVETIESEIGTPVPYLREITAFDDFGRELDVYIDDSEVDIYTAGTYTAIYWAVDYTGLRSEIEVTVHILSVDPEYLFGQIDDILSRILRNDMTQAEKVRAIYTWIVRYMTKAANSSDSQSLIEVANIAVTEQRGDSIIYSAIAELMLTRAGIPNMPINRIDEAEEAHRWMLVNPDERGWHHFDPFPTGLVLGMSASMFTDSEAEDFAKRIKSHSGVEDYFTYDAELYPEIVEE
ncbi:MAG: transglutaminase-like domain-containing protein [Oscillospiraceae bacterium]|jgi:hypothetical protein|nr:transglutaminase-like domain-containing protein [Oscillospiraceae bacterium]